MLYSCEPWLSGSLRAMEKHYMSGIKTLWVFGKQHQIYYAYLKQAILSSEVWSRKGVPLSPTNLCTAHLEKNFCQLLWPWADVLIALEPRERRDAVVKNIDKFRSKCSELGTKVNTYCTLNPELTVHVVYSGLYYIRRAQSARGLMYNMCSLLFRVPSI